MSRPLDIMRQLDPHLVREQLFVLAHDEHRGGWKERLHQPALSVGLAGAAIIDLLIDRRVHLVNQAVTVTDLYDRSVTGDAVTDGVLGLVRQRSLPLPAILDRVAGGMYERTRGGLVHRGVLVEKPLRVLGVRLSDRVVLAHEYIAIRNRAKVVRRADGRDGPTPAADAMCVLLLALGMQDCLILPREEADRGLNLVLQQMQATEVPEHRLLAHDIIEVAEAVQYAVHDLATSAMS